jgi:hypothetical protein
MAPGPIDAPIAPLSADALFGIDPRVPPERMIVGPGERTHPLQLEWNPEEWRTRMQWIETDQPSHPFHFWHDVPTGGLMAVGGSQPYNQLAPGHSFLLHADHDPRQGAFNVVSGAIHLVADRPEDWRERFLRLHTPEVQAELTIALRNVESEHGHLQGRRQLFEELVARTDSLSLRAVQETYRESVTALSQPSNLDENARATFDWYFDGPQFETVRDAYRGGLVTFVQMDVFNPKDWEYARLLLDPTGIGDNVKSDPPAKIATLALSDPHDLLEDDPGKIRRALHGLSQGLARVFWAEEARIQWTSTGGIPRGLNQRDYAESLPGYAYVDTPALHFQHWLRAINNGFGSHSPSPFLPLHEQIAKSGIFMDGKLWISFPDQETSKPGFLNPARRLAYWVRTGRYERAQQIFSRHLRRGAKNPDMSASRLLAREADTLLDPIQRGDLRVLLANAEAQTRHTVFPESEPFDPRPPGLRTLITQPRQLSSIGDRQAVLHERRFNALQRARRGR